MDRETLYRNTTKLIMAEDPAVYTLRKHSIWQTGRFSCPARDPTVSWRDMAKGRWFLVQEQIGKWHGTQGISGHSPAGYWQGDQLGYCCLSQCSDCRSPLQSARGGTTAKRACHNYPTFTPCGGSWKLPRRSLCLMYDT